MSHKYWFAFSTNAGGGACEIHLAKPMRGTADVNIVRDMIREKAGISGTVVITHWTKFEDER